MSVSLPVILGASAVIVALLCIGVAARRRARRARRSVPEPDAVEAVFVDDMPGELQSFMPPAEPRSEPAREVHAHVFPVHKLQQAVAEPPITFGPSRRDELEAADEIVVREPVLRQAPAPAGPVLFDQESEAESEIEPEPVAPKLEIVPDPEVASATSEPEVAALDDVAAPEAEPEVEAPPVVPVLAREPVIELLVEQEPEVETAPVTEPVPTEVALLSAQIEVLAETIARLTDRIDAVASAAPGAPEPEAELASVPDLEPELVLLRSVADEPDAEFALEAELDAIVEPDWEPDVEPDVEPEIVSVIEPQSRPEPIARADRMVRPPAAARRPAAEPTTYVRKRVDDDLLAWPSDEDLEQFSGRQARRDG